MYKGNISFSGGNSKGISYLRVVKELDNLGGFGYGRISGSSIGGVFAIAISCQYSEPRLAVALSKFPGQNVMRYDISLEHGNILYAIPMLIGAYNLTDKLQKYYNNHFNWSMVPNEVEPYISFALQDELDMFSGHHKRLRFRDYYNIMKGVGLEHAASMVSVYYGGKHGIYVFDKKIRQLKQLSDEQIPLGELAFHTMTNPLFKDRKVSLYGHTKTTFDGGIADNSGSTAQVEPFYQINCFHDDAKDLTSYYKSLAPKPIKEVDLKQVRTKKAFFEFTPEAILEEDAVPATNIFN